MAALGSDDPKLAIVALAALAAVAALNGTGIGDGGACSGQVDAVPAHAAGAGGFTHAAAIESDTSQSALDDPGAEVGQRISRSRY